MIAIIIILLLLFILGALSSTYMLHKKQLENQERIISRLDLLWKEMNANKNTEE